MLGVVGFLRCLLGVEVLGVGSGGGRVGNCG